MVKEQSNLEPETPIDFEDVTYTKLHIVEDEALSDQTNGEYHRIRMLGSVADKVNLNNRLYPKKVWEKQIPRIKERITSGRFVGHTNHPTWISGGVEDIVIKFEDVWFGNVEGAKKTSKELWLEGILIPTHKGADIAQLATAGVELGVSSRGSGSTKAIYKAIKKKGDSPELDYWEVQDDYEVDAFDVVHQPAEDDARVYKFEHRQDDPMDVGEVRERYPELVAAIESAVKEPLDVELAEREEELVGLRTSAEKNVATLETLVQECADTTEALDSARSEIELAQESLSAKDIALEGAQTLIETHEVELVELRPLKGRLEALNHLLGRVKGEPTAWLLVDALQECGTLEEIDEKFDEAKDKAETLLYAEDFLGTRGGKGRYGPAPTDAESDEEFEKNKEAMGQAAKRAGLS